MGGKQRAQEKRVFRAWYGKARSLENVNPIPILCNPLLTMVQRGVVW